MVFKRIASWFRKDPEEEESRPLTPFELPIDEEEIFKESKKILQQLDEYITASELESENLSIQLDAILSEQEVIRTKIKELNKPDSWHERNLLLKLDRHVVHGNNLKQRVELFSQNIKVYLNLMSKVEDIRVMRLNGLETDRIENIWLEFQQSLETYRQKITTEAVTETREPMATVATEERLFKLRQQVFGLPVNKELSVSPITSGPIDQPTRPALEKVVLNRKLSLDEDADDIDLDDDEFDDFEDEDDEETESSEWDGSVKDAVKRLEEG